jgi:hypothetical protein
MQSGKPSEEIYRCLLCGTHLQRASGPTAWEILQAPQPTGDSPPAVGR